MTSVSFADPLPPEGPFGRWLGCDPEGGTKPSRYDCALLVSTRTVPADF